MLAIPAHLALHFLNGRVRAIVRDMEWSGNEIMKYLNTEYKAAGARRNDRAPARPGLPPAAAAAGDGHAPLRERGAPRPLLPAFGSRFVLAPGLGVDFQLPQLAGAQAGAAQATDVISVLRSGQILTSEQGLVDIPQLRAWLKAKGPGSTSRPSSSGRVPR
jgi:hypothetical protein